MLFRFLHYPVYGKAKEFRRYTKTLTIKFPSSEKFVLVDQINRAALSICLNIAEGSNRDSDKDKAHFLNLALTSLEEVVAGFDIALTDKYISAQEMEKVINFGEEVGKQLIGFSKSLKGS